MSEGAIVSACLEWLAIRRIYAWRNNSGALRDPGGRLVKFGHPGSADILGVLPGSGRILCIECKTPEGRQSKPQKLFQKMIEQSGGVYILARSVDDLQRHLAGL